MSYINITFNHFAAIQRWAMETGAQALMDMKDMTLEVKHRGRYYRMHPMFQGLAQRRLVHLSSLTPDVRGFGGWRPYTTLTHPLSNDKQRFKAYLLQCGLRTPVTCEARAEPPPFDYVIKARTGSFGQGLLGPYRAGTPAQVADETAFAEQFVPGQMLKVWFWGSRPFFAHMEPFPDITGDGRSTVEHLLRGKLADLRVDWDEWQDREVARQCVAFQGCTFDTVLDAGRQIWIEFRYGRYLAATGPSAVSDNALQPLADRTGTQLQEMGRALADVLRQTMPLPVMITVDGMLDGEGRIWWLEMNTNSLMPPEGYAAMFADLFA